MRFVRLLPALALLALALGLASGCGSSSDDSTSGQPQEPPEAATSTAPPGAVAKSCDSYAVDIAVLRVTGLSCEEGRKIMYGWQRDKGCSGSESASRSSCTVHSYRCLGIRTNDGGGAISCATTNRSVAFIVKPRR